LISTWGPPDSEGSKHATEDRNHSTMPYIVLYVYRN